MLKGKILTLLLSGVLATNISSIVATAELFSGANISRTEASVIPDDALVESSTNSLMNSTDVESSLSLNDEENSNYLETIESSALLETTDYGLNGSTEPDSISESEEVTAIPRESENVNTLAVVEVSTWEEFQTAVEDESVTDVILTADIVGTSLNTKITHQINIDFNGYTLTSSLLSFRIETEVTAKITVFDLAFSGSFNATMFSGGGEITFKGQLQSLPGNGAAIANVLGGTIVLDGVNMTYDRQGSYEAGMTAKNLSIINQSVIKSESSRFFSNVGTENDDGTVMIDDASKLTLNSNKGEIQGQIWLLGRKVNFYIQGSSSLNMTGDLNIADNTAGLLVMQGEGSSLNVLENSTITAYSKNTSVVTFYSLGVTLNVDDHSLLQFHSGGQSSNITSTLSFRTFGQATFNISNQSKIEIIKTKDKETGVHNGPALSMSGAGNAINISGGSDFVVKNEGSGTPADPGTWSGNQGIYYQGAQKQANEFNIMDENSSVYIDADNGAAIDGGSGDLYINTTPGNYFIARGKTARKDKGILVSGTLTVDMQALKYFDFRNDGLGNIFDVAKAISFYESTFRSGQSDLSVWSKNTNLDGEPTHRWEQVDYALSGNNFENLVSTSDPDMQTEFGSLPDYARMSANNQSSQVDFLRTPTNADKYIYAHAIVPEAKNEYRDAFTDEVHLKVGIFDELDEQVATVEGNSIGDPLSVYSEEEEMGLFKIAAPGEELLKANHTIKILEAWRGFIDDEWQYQLSPEDVFSEQLKVYDVVPPATATTNRGGATLSPTTKEVVGTGEVGANVSVSLNGILTQETAVVDASGNYTISLPGGLQKEDVIHVYLQDNAGSAAVINPPITNSSIGNIQQTELFAYHDTEFEPALKLTVVGVLELSEVPTLFDFGTQAISNTTKKYAPTVEGNLIVADTRGAEKTNWVLGLKEKTPLISDMHSLSGLFKYTNENQVVSISEEKVIVEEGSHDEDGEQNLSSKWNEEQGISLEIPVEKQLVGNYKGTLEWSLEDVPSN